ncbi:MAG: hypothetical protein WBA12_14755 [Catalinimonas sp.]
MRRRHQREQRAIRRILDRQRWVYFIQVGVLLAVAAPFVGWAWWTYRPDLPFLPPDDFWLYTVAALYGVILLGSQIAFRLMLSRLLPPPPDGESAAPRRLRLRRKLESYFWANLIRYSGYEVVGLLCVGTYFFTQHLVYLGFTILSLVLYFVHRPDRTLIADELQLRRRETRILLQA